MNNLYQVLDELREFILLSDFTNTVTFGELSDVDLSKLTNFPLVHIVLGDATIRENTIDFEINMLACDIVDQSKELPAEVFLGNNNVQDILATQMKVVTDICNFLRRNDKVVNKYITIVDDVRAVPFLERFENQLAGWDVTLTLQTRMQDKC